MPRMNAEQIDIIKSVKTPLNFFVLAVLVGESLIFFMAGPSPADIKYLYYMVFILVLLIMVVAVIGYYKPWVLTGAPPPKIDDIFAERLAKNVFEALDGSISNESDKERAAAYNYLVEVCSNATYYNDSITKSFANKFLNTIIESADIKLKYKKLQNL